MCMEPTVRALAGREFCKPCKKYYDDSKGLEAHKKRRYPKPTILSSDESCGRRKAGIITVLKN